MKKYLDKRILKAAILIAIIFTINVNEEINAYTVSEQNANALDLVNKEDSAARCRGFFFTCSVQTNGHDIPGLYWGTPPPGPEE